MKKIVCAFAVLCLLALLPAQAEDAAGILARAKEAAGGKAWDAVRALHTRARLSAGGLSGTAESWVDVRTGRFLDSFVLGPVTGAEGFDGKVKWSQDPSGQTLADDSGDAREGTVNDAYLRSLAFWYPERRPAEIAYAGRREEAGRAFHVLRIHPEGGRPFELWIDAASCLIDRTVERTAGDLRTTFFSDYRAVDGVEVAFASRSTNGEAKYDQTVTVDSVEVNPPLDEAKFRMPAGRTDDFAIAGGKTSATIPFELLNNHIYVRAEIDGKPLQVLFDTGGANILTPAAAQRLGLKTEGKLQGRGAGEKSEDLGLTKVSELKLGELTLRNQVFYTLPLAGLAEAEGMDVDGVVGYEVLKRFIARVEYARRRLTFTLPAAFREPPAGTVVPFTFDGQTPQVEGEVDGVPGKFTIDTGSRASLTLNRPFAEEHGLQAKYAPQLEALAGWGVGGGVRSAFTRVKSLKLGNVEIPAPVTDLALSQKGAFANRYLAGNVGGGVLRRFDVTFDYGKQRLIFEPNASFATPDSYDRSGMWLNREGAGFAVKDVVAGGPAAAAGLKVGDAVLAIDGRSAGELRLPEVRERLRESPPGTEVRLTVESGGKSREVTLVLRDLV
jgi:predicted aspartyl protease